MSDCKTCSTNVIGPLTYRYSGFGTATRNCGCAKTYCGCTKCDVDLEFDYGTTGLIKIDWSKTLKRKGACKVMSSEWRTNKTATVDLVYGDQSFNDNCAQIYVSGGIYAGEYELINEICTERGDTMRKTVCVKLVGSDCGNSIPIAMPACEIIPDPNAPCVTNGMLFEGSYCKTDFCDQPYCKISLTLLEGSAHIINDGLYEMYVNEEIVISTMDLDLKQFFVEVDCDSKVVYELQQIAD